MPKTYTVEQIYEMMMTTTFERWYGDTFTDHVVGEDWAMSKDQIMDELETMLF